MDALRRTGDQFLELYRNLSPSQRLTLIAVPLMILGALYLLITDGSSSSYTALSWGKPLTTEERLYVEQALKETGLTDFHVEGQRIMVPASQVDRYNAVLLQEGSLPGDSMSEWERQIEKSSGLFSSTKELEMRMEYARKEELRKVIRALPDVKDAHILWPPAADKSPFGSRRTQRSATVSVQPHPGRELSPQMRHSIRMMVANAVTDLSPENVTVVDLSTHVAHSPDTDGTSAGRLLSWIKNHTQRYQRLIEEALSHIPNVRVAVNIDLEEEQSATEWPPTSRSRSVARFRHEWSREDRTPLQSVRGGPGQVANEPRTIRTITDQSRTRSAAESGSDSPNPLPEPIEHRAYLAPQPKSVQVTVSIPETYYETVAVARGLVRGSTPEQRARLLQAAIDAGLRTQETQKIERTVARLIGSPLKAVTVDSYTPVEKHRQPGTPPLTGRLGRVLIQWGGTIGLVLFAVGGLWLLKRSTTKAAMAARPADRPLETGDSWKSQEEESDKIAASEEMSKRDLLQATIRDNPELAAAVLSRWIQAAR